MFDIFTLARAARAQHVPVGVEWGIDLKEECYQVSSLTAAWNHCGVVWGWRRRMDRREGGWRGARGRVDGGDEWEGGVQREREREREQAVFRVLKMRANDRHRDRNTTKDWGKENKHFSLFFLKWEWLGEREREREIDRQTDRQTNKQRQTNRDRDTGTETERNRDKERRRYREDRDNNNNKTKQTNKRERNRNK